MKTEAQIFTIRDDPKSIKTKVYNKTFNLKILCVARVKLTQEKH